MDKRRIHTIIFLLTAMLFVEISLAQKPESKEEVFFTIAPRAGMGIHNFLNYDFGISALYISNRPLQWGAASAYTSFIFQQSDWNSSFNLNGYKVGIQSSWAIFMWGLEWKSLEFKSNYFSLKFGLSWLDVFNLEYLINIIHVDKEYPINTPHQVALNISFNRKIYKNIWKK